MLLSERHSQLQLDPVRWGYALEWWNKPALTNARSETATGNRIFRSLWEHRRAIVFADNWLEWKQQNGVKQPSSIYRKDGNPLLFATIGRPPFKSGSDQGGFLIVTAATDEGLLGIHDRQPLVYLPVVACKWLSEDITDEGTEDITYESSFPTEDFTQHLVSRAVGNSRSQGRELTESLA